MRRIRSDRSGKSTCRIASFPENPYVALEEACAMLGMTENQLKSLSALLERTDAGYLDFHVGNLCIEFSKNYEEEGISLHVEVRKGETTQSMTYPLKLLREHVKSLLDR